MKKNIALFCCLCTASTAKFLYAMEHAASDTALQSSCDQAAMLAEEQQSKYEQLKSFLADTQWTITEEVIRNMQGIIQTDAELYEALWTRAAAEEDAIIKNAIESTLRGLCMRNSALAGAVARHAARKVHSASR
jgi:hypothetical protein